jgi:hypothetical protein
MLIFAQGPTITSGGTRRTLAEARRAALELHRTSCITSSQENFRKSGKKDLKKNINSSSVLSSEFRRFAF